MTLDELSPRRRKSDYKHSLYVEFGPYPWSTRIKLLYLWRVMLRVFVFGDTTTIRATFAAASFCFGCILVLHPDTLDRKYFHEMSFAPWWAWMLAFWSHTLGVLWRFLDKPRFGWGFAVNAWGLFLWILSTYLQVKAAPELPPSISMEIVVIVAGFVALCRNGLNDDDMSP